MSMKGPIASVDDLRRLKMWTTPAGAKPLSALGVTIVTGPAVRIFEIVSKGTVDGYATLGISESVAFKVSQFTKSVLLIPGKIITPTFMLFANPKKWASIAAKDREAILAVSGEEVARLSRGWHEWSQKVEAEYRAEGTPITEASGELLAGLQRAWRPLHDEWIEEATKLGVDGKAAFAYYVEQSKLAAERR
jgi:TRAP-type C4-dicarboxylate transport system substrate-binding protein